MTVCSVEGCQNKKIQGRGWCEKHYGRWRKHQDPLFKSRGDRGNGYTGRDGRIKITADGIKAYKHTIIVEAILGHDIPPGALVHHIDGNASNNENSNLVLCQSNGYHALLHRRKKALESCGNSRWRKCPFCKEYDDPGNMYVPSQGCAIHRSCATKYMKEWRNKNGDPLAVLYG